MRSRSIGAGGAVRSASSTPPACAGGRESKARSSSCRSPTRCAPIRFAEIVILVLDAMQPLERQDLTIARLVAEEGRALVLAASKWDAVADRPGRSSAARPAADIAAAIARRLVGAGLGGDRLRPRRADGCGRRRRRGVEQAHPDRPSSTAGLPAFRNAIRRRWSPAAGCELRYITQVNIRPPSFALFASKPGELPGFVPPLSRQCVARGVRAARRAGSADAAPGKRSL